VRRDLDALGLRAEQLALELRDLTAKALQLGGVAAVLRRGALRELLGLLRRDGRELRALALERL